MFTQLGCWIAGIVTLVLLGVVVVARRLRRAKQSVTQDEVVRELYPLW
jgi:hypothetical protein